MPRFALVFAAACAATLALSSTPSRATAGPDAAHPYFDDKGTLAWHCDLPSAQAAARASGRLVFIEYGRRACGNCRVLVQRVMPQPCVKARLSSVCVGLAADCDEPDPVVTAVFHKAMPDASLLPFVAVVTPDLEYVTGWSGSMDVDGCARQMDKIDAWRARRAPKTAPATVAATVVAPLPTPVAPPRPPAPRGATTAAAPASRTIDPAPAGVPGPAAGNSAAALAAARALLARAEAAATQAQYALVLELEREAAALTIRVEPARWGVILAKADAWAEGLLAKAAADALAGRTGEAERCIAGVRRDAHGRGACIDAERGARAITLRRFIDASAASTRERALADARISFRGTRWEALFAA